jgi:hypothetical protein
MKVTALLGMNNVIQLLPTTPPKTDKNSITITEGRLAKYNH